MIADIIKDAEHRMAGAIDHAREEFGAIRTGRAHPAMFNKILVDYYGSPTPLQQLATFQVPEAAGGADQPVRSQCDGRASRRRSATRIWA